MKNTNHAHWILHTIAEEQAPENTINLWSQIESLLALRSKKSLKRVTGKFSMKKSLLYATIALALLTIAATAFIPTVRVRVTDWISGQTAVFSFIIPHSKVAVGLFSDGPWGFVPLSPTYMPHGDWVTVPDSYTDEVTGVDTLKLTFNKGDQFVILTERKALPGEALPVGKEVRVNDQSALLVNGLSGEANASIPLDKNGGVLPEPSGLVNLSPLQYTDGVQLTWQWGEIRLEIFSNLSERQVLKIAASLQVVEVEPAQITTSEP